MQPAARRVPSPPPQHPNMMNVSWQDFLKETKEVSWQEALLETHFEAQRAPNKPNLVRVRWRAIIYAFECIQQLRTTVALLTRVQSSWQDFLRQTSDTYATLSSSPSPPDSPKLEHEMSQENKEKGRLSPVQGTSPPSTGSSPPALSSIPNDPARISAGGRASSQMLPSKEPKVSGSKEKGLVCKIASQPNVEELSAAHLPPNSHELQQLICKKIPQLRAISPAVFPSLGNLTVLWIEKAALQDLPVDMFTLTKVRVILRSGPGCCSARARFVDREDLTRSSQLEHLFLGHNQIREIPAEIGRLVNLKKLNLQHNQIVDLPPTIRHLTQLRSLYASLSYFPIVVFTQR